MLSPDAHKRLRYQGCTTIRANLMGMAGTLPVEGVESFAEGVLDGVRDFLSAYVSERAAYDALQRAADRTGAPLLPSVPNPGAGDDKAAAT